MGPLRYEVTAYNATHDSENKIHDDAVARRFGFAGGLVASAEIYAYMTQGPVRRWGRAWIEHGASECRFLKPVYDGDVASVTATEADADLAIAVESRGEVCATGAARMPAADRPPPLEQIARVAQFSSRPPADETSLAPGVKLGLAPLAVTPEFQARYLEEVRETLPLYADERLVHPGLMLRLANSVIKYNVLLGPWIHVASTVRHFAAAPVGCALTAQATILANYERKGHRLFDADVFVLADERTLVAHVKHTAIYRPRQVAEVSQIDERRSGLDGRG